MIARREPMELGGDIIEFGVEILPRSRRPPRGLAVLRPVTQRLGRGFRLLEDDAVEPFAERQAGAARRLLGSLAGVIADPLNTPRNSRFHCNLAQTA